MMLYRYCCVESYLIYSEYTLGMLKDHRILCAQSFTIKRNLFWLETALSYRYLLESDNVDRRL